MITSFGASWRRACLVALALLLGGARAAQANEYFMVIVSYQTALFNLPDQSHTFASFIEADDAGRLLPQTRFDISWLPQTGDVRFLAKAEPGKLFSFEESVAFGLRDARGRTDLGLIGNAKRIRRLGPFGVDANFFRAARAQHARLKYWGESVGPANYAATNGRISQGPSILVPGIFYKAVDGDARAGNWDGPNAQKPTPAAAVNCIHAVSDIGGYLASGDRRGFEGGRIAGRWLAARHAGGNFLSHADAPRNQQVARDWRFGLYGQSFSMAHIPLDR